MFETAYHTEDLSKSKFLVTGGAGFIGSNLVAYLLKHGAGKVLVLDNLSTGSLENLKAFDQLQHFQFVQGDINDTQLVSDLCKDVSFVFHQAALGSVPRSIKDPLATHQANATGFLSVLEACRIAKVKRLIYASSSSVYGDSQELPKKEGLIGAPKSPYAITKLVDEMYATLYGKLHGLEVIGLRYFNIFGPQQNPNGPYAAAIPLFILAALNGGQPTIFGDGNQTRDFTFVENAVQANIRSAFSSKESTNQVYNIACGGQYRLNEVIQLISEITGKKLEVNYAEPRSGDILHSMASIEKAQANLNFDPKIQLHAGLEMAIDWYRKHPFKN